VRVVFYLKRLFCQISKRLRHSEGWNKFQLSTVSIVFLAKLFCKLITVLLGEYLFVFKFVIVFIIQKGVAHVYIRSSCMCPVARPGWLRLVRSPVQFRRAQQHGSSREMMEDSPIH